MKRGDIHLITHPSGGERSVVVVQEDSFDGTDSITVCPLTAEEMNAPMLRLPLTPNCRNGLSARRHIMVDKITTISKSRIGLRRGRLDDDDVLRLNRAILIFLGLAVSPRANRKDPDYLGDLAGHDMA